MFFSFLCYCRSCFPFECLNDDELYRELFLARNQSDLQYLNRGLTLSSDNDQAISDNCSYTSIDDFNLYYKEVPGLSILNLNSCSKVKNFNELKHLLESISKTFHVIVITESWLDNHQSKSQFTLDNYQMFSIERKAKRGGGILIYVRSNLDISVN